MWKVWLKRLGLLVLAGLFLFVFGWAPYFLAGVGTSRRFAYQDRENGGLTPATFGLAFEDVSFRASDGVPLAGWWVGAPDAKGTVVMVHGLNRSRIEMVRRVPFVHGEGWNALADRPATPRRERRDGDDLRREGEAGRRGRDRPGARAGGRAGRAVGGLARRRLRHARGERGPPGRGRRLRQQLPLARRHAPAPPAPVPGLEALVAPGAGLARGGRGPVLDGPARRVRSFDRGRACGRGASCGAARALRGELRGRQDAQGDRVRARGRHRPVRGGAGRAEQEPRRGVAGRHRGLRGGGTRAAAKGAAGMPRVQTVAGRAMELAGNEGNE